MDEVTAVEAIRIPSPIHERESLDSEIEENTMVTPTVS